MLTIFKDRLIHIEWTIFKGTSNVREDFTRALVKCFLIGPREKYLVEATAKEGTLFINLPQGLEEGAYSIEVIYVKNQGNLTPRREPLSPSNAPDYRRTPYPPFTPHDARFNDRCIMRSRRDCLFAITEYEQEEEGVPTFSSGEVTLRFNTSTASYGYDGLSAYEIAVMRGDFNGSEGEWIKWINQKILDYVSLLINNVYLEWKGSAYLTRISMPYSMRKKGIIITYKSYNGEVYTEKNVNDDSIENEHWGIDSSWVRIDELSLSGDISVSTRGTWIINGIDTNINAVGPQGKPGATITPRVNLENDTIEYSWDNSTWHEMFKLSIIRPTVNVNNNVTVLNPGETPTVSNEGDLFNLILKFGMPSSPRLNIGKVNYSKGVHPSVSNSGSQYDAIFDFTLPDTNSIKIGNITTLKAGSKATVINTGTLYDVILNFGIPTGNTGAQGQKGDTTIIKGIYETEELLKSAFPTGDANNAYLIGTTTPYSLYLYLNDSWKNVGIINQIEAGVFDGGRADSTYGGSRVINCGNSETSY